MAFFRKKEQKEEQNAAQENETVECALLTREDVLERLRECWVEMDLRNGPLTEEVAAILEGQRRQNKKERKARKQGKYHQAPESIVFPFGKEQTSREFKKLCPAHHLHDLRHTFITRCAESGVNVTVCQQIVGHTTADMTLNVYTHVMDEFKRKELEKFTINPRF